MARDLHRIHIHTFELLHQFVQGLLAVARPSKDQRAVMGNVPTRSRFKPWMRVVPVTVPTGDVAESKPKRPRPK